MAARLCIFALSTAALSVMGRRANYESILQRIRMERVEKEPGEGMSIEEMTRQSREATMIKKATKSLMKLERPKASTKTVTNVFRTRRKKIVKKRRISRL